MIHQTNCGVCMNECGATFTQEEKKNAILNAKHEISSLPSEPSTETTCVTFIHQKNQARTFYSMHKEH